MKKQKQLKKDNTFIKDLSGDKKRDSPPLTENDHMDIELSGPFKHHLLQSHNR